MHEVENAYWCGELIKGMDRDQLLAVISDLADLLNEAHRDHKRTLEVWSACQLARSPLIR